MADDDVERVDGKGGASSQVARAETDPNNVPEALSGLNSIDNPSAALDSSEANSEDLVPPKKPEIVEIKSVESRQNDKQSLISGDSDWSFVSPDDPSRTNIEIRIVEPHRLIQDQYEEVESDLIEAILGQVLVSNGEDLFKVELRDGVIKNVRFDELLQLVNGPELLDIWNETRPRRSGIAGVRYSKQGDEAPEPGSDSDEDSQVSRRPARRSQRSLRARSNAKDDSEDEISGSRPFRRSTRSRNSQSRQGSRVPSGEGNYRSQRNIRQSGGRQLRPRTVTSLIPNPSDYIDELAQESLPSSEESDFQIIRPDPAAAPRRPRLGKMSKRLRPQVGGWRGTTAILTGSQGSDTELEPARRSGRSTRNQKNMSEATFDQQFQAEERGPSGTLKIAAVKEVFQPVPEDSDFAMPHVEVCISCGNGPNKTVPGGVYGGALIFCQGCSYAYHKPCIGIRAAREHMATKIGPDNFVLQCRFCIGAKAKEKRAARPDICQDCKGRGPSCAAFSQKKTSKQEEALRKENGGEDPITMVAPRLLNNADNVLFRCFACKRAWHFDHLPSLSTKENITESDIAARRDQRLKEYSDSWKCRECRTYTRKIESLVAWRLVPSHMKQLRPRQAPQFQEFGDDDMEYLVKWHNRSYFHCIWMPGAWVSGACHGGMRSAFAKKAAREKMFKKDEEEAIPDDYLSAEIILDVKYGKPGSAKSLKADMARIDDVAKIYVKFAGLPYEHTVWDAPPSKESGRIYDAFRSAYFEHLKGRHFKGDGPLHMKNRVKEFQTKPEAEIQVHDKPESMADDLKLMNYQLQGVTWLLRKYAKSENGILADEMGLGKTLQVLAFVSTLVFAEPKVWPFLVVVPNATCPNWRRETKRFAPKLRIVTYHGGKVPQDLAYKYELFPGGTRDLKAHLVIMSYDSAEDEKTWPLFKGVHWQGLIVDEGQRLKNDKNLLYQALKAIKFPFKLLLTGTPVQNNKRELFNLLQFVDRTKDAEALDQEYETLTDQKLRELHALISPYVLRRTKVQVLKFLPPCENIIVPVTMSVLQQKVYKSILEKSPELLRAIFSQSKLQKKERGSLNNILMQLRKCLAHPFMYSDNIEEDEVDREIEFRNLVEASAKLKLLEIMLPKLHRPANPDGPAHRVLIFSQFLGQLDIVEDFLTGLGLVFRRLDGSMSSLEKQKRIDEFNNDPSIFAFLLSTRAGGVGINLATADTVIIMDPDFNPHQDLQASSRAHRIGQQNPVLVIQLMTRKTVEERIMQIGKTKMALDHAVIERMDAAREDEDLEGILRHGADELFGKNEPEMIRYTSASVDKLLQSRPTKKPAREEDHDTPEQQVYHFGQVWSSEKGLLDLADPDEVPEVGEDAWAEIVALREKENAARLQAKQEVLGRGGRKRQVVDYRTGARLNGLEVGVLSDSDAANADEDFRNGEEESLDDDSGGDDGALPDDRAKATTAARFNDQKAPSGSPSLDGPVKRRKDESDGGNVPKKVCINGDPTAAHSHTVDESVINAHAEALQSRPIERVDQIAVEQARVVEAKMADPAPATSRQVAPPPWEMFQPDVLSQSGPWSAAAQLQALRNSIVVWNEVERCFRFLQPEAVYLLTQMRMDMVDPWWFRLNPEAWAQFDAAFNNLKYVAAKYGGPILRQALGLGPAAWEPRSTGGMYQLPPLMSYGSVDYRAGPFPPHPTFSQPQPLPTMSRQKPSHEHTTNGYDVPTLPQSKSRHLAEASKADIRIQLDMLKSSNLPREETLAMQQKLVQQLRSFDVA